MTRFLFTLILFAFTGLHTAPAMARYVVRPPVKTQEKFNKQEKHFLMSIAKEAEMIVSASLKKTSYQTDCIERYINKNNPCTDSAQIIQAVKAAYVQYRTYFIMSDYGYYLSRVTGRAAMAARERPIPMSTDYSDYSLWVHPKERERITQLRKDDETFINSMKDSCLVNMDKQKEHYQRQLAQIVTLVPVVLMINTERSQPSDQEILDGYKELKMSVESRLDTFVNYDKSNLEGLWAYQMLAEAVADRSIPNRAAFESLAKKIEPQGFWEHIGDWISKTFFSYNILFIGCTVVAIVTVNPLIAMACAVANTLMSSYNVYKDVVEVGNKRAEWLAGVNTFDAIATAKMQMAVDSVLLMLNLGATSVVVKSAMGNPVLSADFHRELLKTQLNSEVLKQKGTKYVKDLVTDTSKGEVQNYVGTMLIGNAQYLLGDKEVDHISQASADLIIEFRKKGLFTYKDTATATCKIASSH